MGPSSSRPTLQHDEIGNDTRGEIVKMLGWLLALAAILLVVLFALRYFLPRMQRSMLFPAPRAGENPPPAGLQSVWFEVPEAGSGARVEGWYQSPPADHQPGPVVVFMHGNGELIDYWPEIAMQFEQWGYGTMLLEYPGYGRSTGRPSERSIRAAAVLAYDWLRERPEVANSPIIGYGRSLGAAAVAQLAAERGLAALLLESTFTSVTAMAARMGLPSALVADPFDTLTVVERFEGPVLVVHGDRDEIVPVSHGERLAEAAGVALIRLPCGHNDCPRPWEEIEEFLSQIP